MHTVTSRFFGNVGPVIENKRNVQAVTQGQNRINCLADFVIANIFQAQLQAIDRTGIKNRLQLFRKADKFDFRRGQKVKAGMFVCVHDDNS